jgi:D-alanyl-D-alanine carboxypeptidase
MNARAATLGCGNTRFTNVHGLKDERQYSTARDLAIILDEALKNQQFAMYFGVNSQILAATNMSQSRKLTTTNYMMDPSSKYYDSRVTGGKPAAATSSDRSMACVAKDGDCEYLVVVISAKAKMSGNAITRYTNFDEASSLLDMGFERYCIQQVLGTEQPYSMYPVSGGKNHVVVGPDADVYALLPIEFDNNLLRLQDTRREEALIAPLQKGTVVGSLQIYYDSIYIGQVDVLARHDVELLDADIADDPVDDVTNQNRFAPVLKWMISILVGAVVSVIAGWLILRRKKRIQKSKAKNNAIERRERGTV